MSTLGKSGQVVALRLLFFCFSLCPVLQDLQLEPPVLNLRHLSLVPFLNHRIDSVRILMDLLDEGLGLLSPADRRSLVIRLLLVCLLALPELLLGLLDLLQILFERLLERRQPVLLPEAKLSELFPGHLALQQWPLLADSLHPQSLLALLRLIHEVLRVLVAVLRYYHAVLEIVLACLHRFEASSRKATFCVTLQRVEGRLAL